MSSTALPQTLKSITATKISELSKQRSIFETRRDEILAASKNAPDLRSKAQVLLEGVARLKGHPGDAIDKDDIDENLASEERVVDSERATHRNIRRFLLQGQYDSSASERSIKDSIAQLENELRYLELKHEHGSFYSELVTEWLATLDSDAAAAEGQDFQQVGRAEMHEQRATWESYVFNRADVDADSIRDYLDRLFGKTTVSREALKELRETIKDFGTEFAAKKVWFTVEELEWVSRALLRSDLLSKEKTAILKEFMRSKEVTQEVADVLNMRLASLDSWSWPSEGISVEMRRQLNGKYRVYMDEDLLDGLLLQYLGLKWAVTLRSAFNTFLNSRAWRSLNERIPKQEKERRQYFRDTRGQVRGYSVNDFRRETYKNHYFMTQLPESVEGGTPDYDEDGSADGDKPKNALDTKHSLLHMLITESIIHRSLHGQFTAIRSDFKYFGPSLPHTTMLTVLAYFGVPEYWLNFFKAFLEAPLKFTQDGPDAGVQVRQRGIPMSHSLSDCFGEAVLFCMDYAVNQGTKGAFLYRLHDDFWFWGHENACVNAWKSMTEFTKVMGLEFNEEKTGTVKLGELDEKSQWRQEIPSDSSSDDSASSSDEAMSASDSKHTDSSILPVGEIRWGFLKLDSQEGRFIIDQAQVDNHIVELKTQLESCKSIFTWVQAWNSYFARFFSNNFAKPALCFGRDHIDMAISTLSRIERTLFPTGVTDHLRSVISTGFNIHDLPEGFFYLPVEFGALELQNPYIPLLSMRENIKQTPSRRMQKAFLDEELQYIETKEDFETHGPAQVSLWNKEPAAFPSLAEYIQYSESRSAHLVSAYKDLLRIPKEVNIDKSLALSSSQLGLSSQGAISSDWMCMSPYWKWVVELYHKEMVRKYGRLAAVDREFMPLGVVKTLKEGKFRWQG